MALFQHDCPHCKSARMPLQVKDIAQFRGISHVWDISLVCPGCNRISVATVEEVQRQGKQPNTGTALINSDWHLLDFHPARPEIAAPKHCPSLVADTYKQAMLAMQAGAWMPGAMAMRKVLEVATKDLDPGTARLALDKRIDALHAAGKLSDGLRDFAHVIRLDGNDAVHEPDMTAEEEAKQLGDFTELFLEYVYTLPGEVLAAIARHPMLANKVANQAKVAEH